MRLSKLLNLYSHVFIFSQSISIHTFSLLAEKKMDFSRKKYLFNWNKRIPNWVQKTQLVLKPSKISSKDFENISIETDKCVYWVEKQKYKLSFSANSNEFLSLFFPVVVFGFCFGRLHPDIPYGHLLQMSLWWSAGCHWRVIALLGGSICLWGWTKSEFPVHSVGKDLVQTRSPVSVLSAVFGNCLAIGKTVLLEVETLI